MNSIARESVAGSPAYAQPRPSQPVAPAHRQRTRQFVAPPIRPGWLDDAIDRKHGGATYSQVGAALRLHPKTIVYWFARFGISGSYVRPTQTPEPFREPPRVGINAILANAVAFYEVDESDLLGRSRFTSVSDPRQETMMACRLAGHTCAETGRWFHRDHSTVLHACNQVRHNAARLDRAMLLADSGTRADLDRFMVHRIHATPSEHEAIRAYLECTLLGERRHPGTRCAAGLWLLARPDYHAGMVAALRACQLAELAPLLDSHLRQLGYLKRGVA